MADPTLSTPFACIILAAGKGTRMKSFLPKVMHKIAGRPMISHLVSTVSGLNPDGLVAVIAPGMDNVQDAVKADSEHCGFIVQETQEGTGHAVRCAESILGDFEGNVLILYGDTPLIRAETLKTMLARLDNNPKCGMALLGMRPADPAEYGRIVTNNQNEVEKIVEFKDASDKEQKIPLCNSGVMAVRSPLLFTLLAKITNDNAKGEYYLTDIVALIRKEGYSCALVEAPEGELLGVNSRAQLAEAERTIQEEMRTRAMEEGATLVDPETVYFSHDTVLGHDVVIHPNVVFGPGVQIGNHVEIRSFCHLEGTIVNDRALIGPFARLRPGTELGVETRIGNFVEVKKSKLARGVYVNHLSYIGDADIGEKANIGAGTITCNYDGFNKYNTKIGAGAFIGSNCSLVAPVTVGDGAITGAGSVITGEIEGDALAIARAEQVVKKDWAEVFRSRAANNKKK